MHTPPACWLVASLVGLGCPGVRLGGPAGQGGATAAGAGGSTASAVTGSTVGASTAATMASTGAMSSTASGTTACAHYVFLSESFTNAALGGLGGADKYCLSQAGTTMPPAGQVWLAILSTSATPANQRILLSGDVCLLDPARTPVASKEQFFSKTHLAAIQAHANGSPSMMRQLVWTASTPLGDYSPNYTDCNAWTTMGNGIFATNGFSDEKGGAWADAGQAIGCESVAMLYCISAPPPPP